MAITGAGLRAMRSIPSFGTIGAIAEIVDNSIQWKTDSKLLVDIVLIERQGAVDEIMIVDNGVGMGVDAEGKEIIDYCLVFGGGTNLNAKSNLGKFGIGLPYACCSQSEEYHVYSWTESEIIKHKMRAHSDFDDHELIKDRELQILNAIPEEVSRFQENIRSYDSGTVVQWKNCDRLEYKKAATIIKHSERELGRIYRNFIGSDIEISYRVFKDPQRHPRLDESLSRKIRRHDFLMVSKNEVFDEPFNEDPPSSYFSEREEVSYVDVSGVTHVVTVSCSLAKKEVQIPNCKPGGNTIVGREYGRTAPISLLRAGRELKNHHFNYKFPNGFGDPRHRWYKIEVSFEPVSDEILGVNANKTDARNFRYIEDEDVSQVDYLLFRYKIAAHIQHRIHDLWKEMLQRVKDCKGVKPKGKCPRCQERSFRNGKCENVDCGFVQQICHEHGFPLDQPGGCPVCRTIVTANICPIHKLKLEVKEEVSYCPECQATPPLNDEEVAELKNMLRSFHEFEDSGDDEMEMLIDWFIQSNKKHFIVFVSNPNAPDSFIDLQEFQRKIDLILVNKNHPFYESQIEPLYAAISEGEETEGFNAQNALDSILLFIIAWSETEKMSVSDRRAIGRFRNRFGIQLNEVLEVWRHLN